MTLFPFLINANTEAFNELGYDHYHKLGNFVLKI